MLPPAGSSFESRVEQIQFGEIQVENTLDEVGSAVSLTEDLEGGRRVVSGFEGMHEG